MENGQKQINNKTGRNVAKFAGCFIGTCLLSAALFLLWCGISYSMRLSVELIRVGITAWYALSGLIGGKILRACKCGAIPFCAVMLGGLFFGILYVCSCIREQHWIALEGENLTILILCTAAALLGSVRWKRSKGCVTVKKDFPYGDHCAIIIQIDGKSKKQTKERFS